MAGKLLTLRAIVDQDSAQVAKKKGYAFDRNLGSWVKRGTLEDAHKEAARVPFSIQILESGRIIS